MNKTIIAIIIITVVVLGGYFIFRGTYQPAPSASQPSASQQSASQPSASEPSNQQSSPQSSVVTYTDTGYSKAILKVKKGETVTFENQSSKSMWTASAAHPSHREYPTTDGCLGSTFDACQGIQPGESWSFQFDITGSWKYHNHLSPSDTGTIVVEIN